MSLPLFYFCLNSKFQLTPELQKLLFTSDPGMPGNLSFRELLTKSEKVWILPVTWYCFKYWSLSCTYCFHSPVLLSFAHCLLQLLISIVQLWKFFYIFLSVIIIVFLIRAQDGGEMFLQKNRPSVISVDSGSLLVDAIVSFLALKQALATF